jgi:hypothetical protein
MVQSPAIRLNGVFFATDVRKNESARHAPIAGKSRRLGGQIECRRTAFVQFAGRSVGGKIKSLARLVLGKCGASIAVPNILFTAR